MFYSYIYIYIHTHSEEENYLIIIINYYLYDIIRKPLKTSLTYMYVHVSVIIVLSRKPEKTNPRKGKRREEGGGRRGGVIL